MMRIVWLVTLLFLVSCATQESSSGDEWELVWQDEFDGEGLPDPDKWGYEEGYIRNDEKQYYTREREKNVRLEDGYLIIEAHKEPYEDFEYTSASINTKETASWTYGRMEVRAKLPSGQGVWPAIWMLGTNIDEVGWPACGEIDIMEYVGFDPATIYANVHTDAYNHVENTGKGSSIEVSKPYDDFQVYAIEWSEEKIDFFVNDRHYFTFENEGTGNDVWPFDKPHYLLLNLAIGGSWGGQEGIDDEIFPQQYYIDYVRVYQRASED